MYATATPTMMSGVTLTPPWVTRRAITTAERGSLSTDTTATPTSTPIAGVSAKPGRCAASRPPTTPRKIAGNVGPPRALPSEILRAALEAYDVAERTVDSR